MALNGNFPDLTGKKAINGTGKSSPGSEGLMKGLELLATSIILMLRIGGARRMIRRYELSQNAVLFFFSIRKLDLGAGTGAGVLELEQESSVSLIPKDLLLTSISVRNATS